VIPAAFPVPAASRPRGVVPSRAGLQAGLAPRVVAEVPYTPARACQLPLPQFRGRWVQRFGGCPDDLPGRLRRPGRPDTGASVRAIWPDRCAAPRTRTGPVQRGQGIPDDRRTSVPAEPLADRLKEWRGRLGSFSYVVVRLGKRPRARSVSIAGGSALRIGQPPTKLSTVPGPGRPVLLARTGSVADSSRESRPVPGWMTASAAACRTAPFLRAYRWVTTCADMPLAAADIPT